MYNFDKISNSFTKIVADDKPIKNTPKCKNKGTQTEYRESESQTDPWEPPLRLPPGMFRHLHKYVKSYDNDCQLILETISC